MYILKSNTSKAGISAAMIYRSIALLHVHVILNAHTPLKAPYTWIRVCWNTLKQDSGGSIAERAVHHVGVASDPANVSNTCIHITRTVVKHVL